VSVVGWIAEHGAVCLCGSSVLLALVTALVALSRDVAERRRLGILGAGAVLVYLVMAALPMQRWRWTTPGAAPAATTGSELMGPPPAPRSARLPVVPRDPVLPAASALVPPSTEALALRLPPPAAARPAVAADRSLAEGLAMLWGVGAGGAMLWLLLGGLSLLRVLWTSRRAPAWLLAELPPQARVRLRIARRPVRPFCCGVLRPCVVLPASLCAPGRAAAARAVLRHELAHLRLGDARAQALFAVLLPLLFFHPLFWWLRRQVRFCGELLADDAAAQQGGVHDYVHELLELAERDHPVMAGAVAVSIFHHPSEFYRRIQMLLQRERPLSHRTSRTRLLLRTCATVAAVVVTAGFFGAPPLPAQEPSPPASRALRRENETLRTTIQDLQQEIRSLRAQVEAIAAEAQGQATSPSAVPPMRPPAAFPDALLAPVAPNAPGLPPAPAAPSVADTTPGVPVLSDLPVIGNMFRTAPAMPGQGPSPTNTDRARVNVVEYQVQKGDTLRRIVRNTNGTSDPATEARVLELNPELDPQRMKVGQTVLVPSPASSRTPAPPTDYAAPVPAVPMQPQEPYATAPSANGAPRDRVSRSTHDLPVQPQPQNPAIAKTTDPASRPAHALRVPPQPQEPYGIAPSANGAPRDPNSRFSTPMVPDAVPQWPVPVGQPPAAATRFPSATTPPDNATPSDTSPSGLPATQNSANLAGILDLTTRYVDLQAEVEGAEQDLAQARQSAEAGVGSSTDASKAERRLRACRHKFEVVQRLAQGELETSTEELQLLQRRHEDETGAQRSSTELQIRRVKARIDAIQSVL